MGFNPSVTLFANGETRVAGIDGIPQNGQADISNHQESASVSHIGSQGQQTGNKIDLRTIPVDKTSSVRELVNLSAWMREQIMNPQTKGIDRLEMVKQLGAVATALGDATKNTRRLQVKRKTREQKQAERSSKDILR